jgi:hypothetical protein
MSWIPRIAPEAAAGELRSIYDRIRARASSQRVAHVWQTLGAHPAGLEVAFAAYRALMDDPAPLTAAQVEAHRYGITAHRKKRTKLGMASQLDSIPGIGPTRRKSLLKHFGSVDKIRSATLEELTAIKGMNKATAESIKAHLE